MLHLTNVRHPRSAAILTIGIIAGFAIASVGTSLAQPDSATIYACASKKTGALKYAPKGRCAKGDIRLVWSVEGPAGATGAHGPRGEMGASGSDGVTGPAGSAGETGPAGPAGPTGATGQAGSLGPAGADGAPGVGMTGLPFTARSVCGANGSSSCIVGSIGPGGGLIFFVDSAGDFPDFDYLEAAPDDASTGVPWITNSRISCGDGAQNCELNWLTTKSDIHDTVAIGAGLTATRRVIDRGSTTLSTYAAGVATAYSTTSASDWFLPSYDELDLMYDNLKAAGLGGFADAQYASSSETGIATVVLAINFANGAFAMPLKTDSQRVRAIRRF